MIGNSNIHIKDYFPPFASLQSQGKRSLNSLARLIRQPSILLLVCYKHTLAWLNILYAVFTAEWFEKPRSKELFLTAPILFSLALPV